MPTLRNRKFDILANHDELQPRVIITNSEKTAISFINTHNKYIVQNAETLDPWMPIEEGVWDILLNLCNKETGWEKSNNGSTIYLHNLHVHDFGRYNPKRDAYLSNQQQSCYSISKIFAKRVQSHFLQIYNRTGIDLDELYFLRVKRFLVLAGSDELIKARHSSSVNVCTLVDLGMRKLPFGVLIYAP